MKKMLLVVLAGVLLLCIFGCVASEPGNNDLTSQPNESTTPSTDVIDVPEETTVPTAITDPADVATHGNLNPGPWGVALSPETMAACKFAQWTGDVGESYRYGYVGGERIVTMPGGGLTVTFPDGWIEKLIVVWEQSSEDYYWTARISCDALLRAWIAHRDGIAAEDVDQRMLALCRDPGNDGTNYILLIMGIPNNVTNVGYDPRGYLGKDEEFTYVFVIPEFWEDWWNTWHFREDMIEALGEDTYNDLLGGMVITEEMAKEMITITNPVED